MEMFAIHNSIEMIAKSHLDNCLQLKKKHLNIYILILKWKANMHKNKLLRLFIFVLLSHTLNNYVYLAFNKKNITESFFRIIYIIFAE